MKLIFVLTLVLFAAACLAQGQGPPPNNQTNNGGGGGGGNPQDKKDDCEPKPKEKKCCKPDPKKACLAMCSNNGPPMMSYGAPINRVLQKLGMLSMCIPGSWMEIMSDVPSVLDYFNFQIKTFMAAGTSFYSAYLTKVGIPPDYGPAFNGFGTQLTKATALIQIVQAQLMWMDNRINFVMGKLMDYFTFFASQNIAKIRPLNNTGVYNFTLVNATCAMMFESGITNLGCLANKLVNQCTSQKVEFEPLNTLIDSLIMEFSNVTAGIAACIDTAVAPATCLAAGMNDTRASLTCMQGILTNILTQGSLITQTLNGVVKSCMMTAEGILTQEYTKFQQMMSSCVANMNFKSASPLARKPMIVKKQTK